MLDFACSSFGTSRGWGLWSCEGLEETKPFSSHLWYFPGCWVPLWHGWSTSTDMLQLPCCPCLLGGCDWCWYFTWVSRNVRDMFRTLYRKFQVFSHPLILVFWLPVELLVFFINSNCECIFVKFGNFFDFRAFSICQYVEFFRCGDSQFSDLNWNFSDVTY